MAPIPAPSPAGQTAASLPGNQAGGGQGYVNSGTCSGTAWTHTQTLQVYYDVSTFSTPNGNWPPGSDTTSALICTVYGNATDTLNQFSTSSSTGLSGCAGAANAVQSQTMTLSSTTATVGFGSAGTIYTVSGGYQRRWARASDIAQTDSRLLTKVVFPVAGLPTGWNNDATISNSVAAQLVAKIIAGGLEYNDYSTPGSPDLATAWTLMDWSLIDI